MTGPAKPRYTLIRGQYRIHRTDHPRQGPQPDGDTIRLEPDRIAVRLGTLSGVVGAMNPILTADQRVAWLGWSSHGLTALSVKMVESFERSYCKASSLASDSMWCATYRVKRHGWGVPANQFPEFLQTGGPRRAIGE